MRSLACVLSVTLVTACGNGGNKADGGSLADGAGAGTIRVRVYSFGDPAPDVDVVVQDAAGAVVASGTTGADGVYQYDGFADAGMITVVEQTRLTTVTALHPGQEVIVGQPGNPTVGATAVDQNGLVGGATTYKVSNGCDSKVFLDAPALLTVRQSCVLDGNMVRYVAYAENGTGRIAYSVTELPSPGEVDGGSILLNGWTTTGLAAVTINVSNYPAGDAGAGLFLLSFDAIQNGIPYASEGSKFSVPSPSATQSVKFAPGAYDSARVTATVPRSDYEVARVVYGHALGGSESYTQAIDLAADPLPSLSAATVDASEAARPSVSWTWSSAVTPDLMSLAVTWTPADSLDPIEWRMIVPGSRTSPVKFPALPSAFTGTAPAGTPTINVVDYDTLDYTGIVDGAQGIMERNPPVMGGMRLRTLDYSVFAP